ncbi:MAG: ankyrin repeat domain-containing protein, partial [Candidatus Berkiella sp.]
MPDDFLDPVSYALLNDPVTDGNGFYFSRETIEKLFETSKQNPLTRKEFSVQEIEKLKMSDKEKNDQIVQWVQKVIEVNANLIDHEIVSIDDWLKEMREYLADQDPSVKQKRLVQENETQARIKKKHEDLIDAVVNNNVDKIKALLQDEEVNVNFKDERKSSMVPSIGEDKSRLIDTPKGVVLEHYYQEEMRTPLFYAAAFGNVEAARLLLQSGAQIDAPNLCNDTPLIAGARSRNLAMVKLLVEHKADVFKQNAAGENALLEALKAQSVDISNYLLSLANAVKLVSADTEEETMVNAAVLCGDVALLSKVIKMGGKINAKIKKGPFEGTFPLITAVMQNDAKALEILLNNKADVNQVDLQGKSALFHAVESGDATLVKLLLERGASKEIKDNAGKTALEYIDGNKFPRIYDLLMRGDKVYDAAKSDALLAESLRNNQNCFRANRPSKNYNDLVDDPKKINKALQYAVEKQDLQFAKMLLAKISDKKTAATKRTFVGRFFNRVKTLFLGDYDVNNRERNGKTPLHNAIDSTNVEMIRLLLSNPNVDILQKSNDGLSIIEAIRNKGNDEISKLILTNENLEKIKNSPNIPEEAKQWAQRHVLYMKVQEEFDKYKGKLTGTSINDFEKTFGALKDLHNNREKYLAWIRQEYQRNSGGTSLLYLHNDSVPYHIEYYDPNDPKFTQVSIEDSISNLHERFKAAFEYITEKGITETWFKNMPTGLCIDSRMEGIDKWISESTEIKKLDTAMSEFLDEYAKDLGRKLGKDWNNFADIPDTESSLLYVEDITNFIIQNHNGMELKDNQKIDNQTVEQYLEDILCLDRRPIESKGNKVDVVDAPKSTSDTALVTNVQFSQPQTPMNPSQR